jgi:hypothetical protein
LVTPWGGSLLEDPVIDEHLKEFPGFYGTWKFFAFIYKNLPFITILNQIYL